MPKQIVKITPTFSIKEATRLIQEKQQNCVLVVDNEDFLEGIVTLGDICRKGYEPSENSNSAGGNYFPFDVCKLPPFCHYSLR
jgi:predicted transcriptional regulator